jgi:uncharacterized protein
VSKINENREIEVEIREDGDKKTLFGYSIKWEKLSNDLGGFQERFVKGAFSKSIRQRNIFAFYNHNSDIILGNTDNNSLRLEENDIGLKFEIDLPNTQQANDVRTLVKQGYIKGVSFAFRANVEVWDESGKIPIRTVQDAELFEISPLPLAAYPQTKVSSRNLNPYEEYRSKEYDLKKFYERNYIIRKKLLENIKEGL